MRNLTLSEDLEEMRTRLAKAMDRPCYVAGCMTRNGTLYKLPDGQVYAPLSSLEAYLSTWTDRGRCVKREGDTYYYDLEPTPTLCFVYPLKHGERTKRADGTLDYGWDDFKLLGLKATRRVVKYPDPGEAVPSELEPYLEEYRSRRGGAGSKFMLRKGICFTESEQIQAPNERHDHWQQDFKLTVGDSKRVLVTLVPPGQYQGSSMGCASEQNNLLITDVEPGPCVVCHGRSGERRHLGVVRFGPDAYASNHICRACAAQTFADLQALLDSKEPI